MIELVKEFWNNRPCNIRHSDKPIGSKEYFDEVAHRKYFVEPHIPDFAEFGRWQNVLEIGCGIGTDTINFAQNGANVTAVELSEKSLEIAKQRAKIYGLEDKITFYLGNAEQLNEFVPVKPYDLIYSFGVIHHTPHPEKIIEQMHHYYKSGTIIKIMVYHRYSWKVLYNLLTKGAITEYSEAQTGCPISYTYSKKDAIKLLNGFKILDMQINHIFSYRISDYVQYRYVKVWYFRWLPDFIFSWLEHHFGWHLCITAN